MGSFPLSRTYVHACVLRLFFFTAALLDATAHSGCTHNLPRKIPISRLWARPVPLTLHWPLPVLPHKEVLIDQVHLTVYSELLLIGGGTDFLPAAVFVFVLRETFLYRSMSVGPFQDLKDKRVSQKLAQYTLYCNKPTFLPVCTPPRHDSIVVFPM